MDKIYRRESKTLRHTVFKHTMSWRISKTLNEWSSDPEEMTKRTTKAIGQMKQMCVQTQKRDEAIRVSIKVGCAISKLSSLPHRGSNVADKLSTGFKGKSFSFRTAHVYIYICIYTYAYVYTYTYTYTYTCTCPYTYLHMWREARSGAGVRFVI